MNLTPHPATRRTHASRTTPLHPDQARRLHWTLRSAMVYSNPSISAENSLQFHSFDATYVARLCEGDRQTEEHFFGYFTTLLKVKLRSRLQSRHAIEDVCQETFARVFKVLRSEGGLQQPERLGPFVNSVCNNVLFELYRSSSRVESLDSKERPDPPATGADALDLAVAGQIKAKVKEILLGLEPRDRFLLQAIFLDQRDRDDVCREFGVDREYLRVLLHRAKQEFKTEYLKRIGGPIPMDAGA